MRTDAERLKTLRINELHFTQQELAEKLHTSLGIVSMIECGQRKISLAFKEQIKNIFNYDIDKELFIEKAQPLTENITAVPFFDIKEYENPQGNVIADYKDSDCLYFDRRWLENIQGVNPYNCSIFEYKQEKSLHSNLKKGDLLLIDHSQTRLTAGSIYLISYEDALRIGRYDKGFNAAFELTFIDDLEQLGFNMQEYSRAAYTVKGCVIMNLTNCNTL